MFISRLEMFIHNFMFLSTFSGKLFEHLNMFIRIGHVSWHLLNMFLGIFVTILLFFISTNQNHFKKKKKKKNQTLLFPISTKINQTLRKILNPTKRSTFIISKPLQNHPNPHKYNQTPTSNIKTETIPKPK
jgi:hypothetical protein